jgi:hypothetical protein
MATATGVRRPFGITLLVVLGVISGCLTALTGLFVMLDRNDPELVLYSLNTPDQLMWAGLIAIAVGVIKVLLALALGGGSEVVRVLFAIIVAFNLGAGVWAVFATRGEQQLSGAFSAVVAGIVLYLLLNHRAEQYFESARA